MKLKILSVLGIILCLNTISCREADDYSFEKINADQNYLKVDAANTVLERDSLAGIGVHDTDPDPPKTGHQWKTKN